MKWILIIAVFFNLLVFDDDLIRPRVSGRPRSVESWERMG